jgi:hypothetical protein
MAFRPHPGMNSNLQDFHNALRYLKKGSPLASGILYALEDLPNDIRVLVKENYKDMGVEGSWFFRPQRHEPACIHWWVYDWTDLGDDRYMNPALALMHEIGHAFQWFKRDEWKIKMNLFLSLGAAVEEDNIQTCEKPIAKQLGQPYRERYVNVPMGNREPLFRQWGKGPRKPSSQWP